MVVVPGFHHLEIWVADLATARREWGWLLRRVGLERTRTWGEDVTGGETWAVPVDGTRAGPAGEAPAARVGEARAYLTLTTSPNLVAAEHDRRRPGVNHVALLGGSPTHVDAIVRDAPDHGWRALYADRYPHAGGPDHYAAWLENAAGFKVEVVAEL